jgi:hypothetical protein
VGEGGGYLSALRGAQLFIDLPLTHAVLLQHIALLRSRVQSTHLITGGPMAATRRTTHRSTAGKKLYAVRDKKGRFVDIQTYERAHRADLKKKSKKEKI